MLVSNTSYELTIKKLFDTVNLAGFFHLQDGDGQIRRRTKIKMIHIESLVKRWVRISPDLYREHIRQLSSRFSTVLLPLRKSLCARARIHVETCHPTHAHMLTSALSLSLSHTHTQNIMYTITSRRTIKS